MRAIKIDVVNRQVTEVDISKKSNLQSIYKALNVSLIELVRTDISDKTSLYIDEEGIYNKIEGGFTITVWGSGRALLVGNGLLIGYNAEDGSSIDLPAEYTVEWVQNRVKFYSKELVERHVEQFK
jgi:hypothetical protein